ncbi:MAG: hypothetical protein H7Y11_11720, partial [Armatimonadetes bacterium]|nr:hypothetical protein [Anaerolineae bacterium]
VKADVNAKIRSGAGTTYNTLGAVPGGTLLQADALSSDGQWARIGFGERVGWVYLDLLADTTALATLPQIGEQARTPMQAFYFTTGIGDVACADAPDMLLVQGPKGVRVNLNVNGADIEIGSTIALINQTADYTAFESDAALSQTFSTTLTGKNLPEGTQCEKTSMVMLEGEAVLNDYVSALPIGHKIDSVACRDSAGVTVLTTPWRGLERLTQAELEQFAVVEQLPANVLSYAVTLPSDTQIDSEVRRLFPNAQPTQSEPALTTDEAPIATDEAVATQSNPDTPPQPTSVPPEGTPEAVPQG